MTEDEANAENVVVVASADRAPRPSAPPAEPHTAASESSWRRIHTGSLDPDSRRSRSRSTASVGAGPYSDGAGLSD